MGGKMLKVITAVLLQSLLVQSAQASFFKNKKFSESNTDELADYFEQVSNGSIYLANHHNKTFFVDTKINSAISEDIFDYEEVLDIFATDVHRYIANENAQDFLGAKKRFYSRQNFNKKKQKFSRPYVYLAAWNSLNHPPIQQLEYPLAVYNRELYPLNHTNIQSRYFDVNFQRQLDDITDTELSFGNKLTQLNNNESYHKRLELIRGSKRYFFGVVMAHYCDQSSTKLIDAMIERAQAGVDVRILLEGLWTNIAFKRCANKMEAGGVKVILTNNFFKKNTFFTLMHDKIWIADGIKGVIGGQNVQDFENGSNGFNMHTRDKDVLVEGPAVTDMLAEYIRLWNLFKRKSHHVSIKKYEDEWRDKFRHERESGLRGSRYYKEVLDDSERRLDGVCRVVVQGPQTKDKIITEMYYKLIEAASQSIIFNTPNLRYQVNGKGKKDNSGLIYAILDRAKRDQVKVDLVSNGIDASGTESGFHLRNMAQRAVLKGQFKRAKLLLSIQNMIAKSLAKKQYKTMSAMSKVLGVDTWTYFNHTHAKQMIFDRILTSTGSFNFDKHSYKNHESTIVCLDKKHANEVEQAFTLDMINSTPVF
jgi:phosphatidylserine/phosphatidylglycerophosphate/cardiolipin synthase-like enzyme